MTPPLPDPETPESQESRQRAASEAGKAGIPAEAAKALQNDCKRLSGAGNGVAGLPFATHRALFHNRRPVQPTDPLDLP